MTPISDDSALTWAEAAIEASSDALAAVDATGAIRLWNRAAEELTQITKDAALGRSIAEALGVEASALHEHTRLRLGGSELELRVLPGPDAGYILRLQRYALAGDSARLAAIVEGSRDAIFSHDFEGTILSWNQGAERLYGYRADEIIGKSLFLLVPEQVDEQTSELHQRVRSGQLIPSLETVRRHRDGRILNVAVSISPIRNERGEVIGVSKTDQDIGERVRTRARLQSSEERFRATFENAAVGMAHVDIRGFFMHVNRRLSDLLGYDADELRKLRFSDITHPDDVEESLKSVQALCRGELDSYQVEKRYFHKSGEIVWAQLTASLVRDENGAPAYFVSVLVDVTERVRLAQALADSERRMRASARVANIGSFEWNLLDGTNVTTPELEALYGLDPGTFTGTYDNWLEALHPDDRERVDQAVKEGIAKGELTTEWRTVWPDGSIHWIEVRGVVDRYENGKAARMIGVNLDVTERVAAEQALRTSELRYRLAIEGGELGTWTYDPERRIGTLDARAKEIFGRSPQSPIPADFRDEFIHPDDLAEVAASFEACRAGKARFWAQPRILRADGKPCWVRIWGTRHLPAGDGRSIIIGVVQDITAQEQAKLDLERASRRKDDYLAMLSHELRNPLAAIRSAGELFRLSEEEAGDEECDPTLAKAARVLERQSAHMATLLDGLLDVSRITRDKLTIEKRRTEPASLLRDLISDRSSEISQRQIELRLRIENEDALVVEADPARLTQIFDNLLTNALKFTDRGGRVDVSAAVVDGRCAIVFSDSGIGFPSELGQHIFEAFQQGPQDLARNRGGLGLGLFLAKRLAELHGGDISASSEGPGRGAQFCVTLPCAAPCKQDTARASDAAPDRTTGLRIILIEDNEDAAEMLGHILTQAGNEVHCARRGEEGMRLISETHPDVVLCDIGLPGDINGYELARQLRSDPATRDLYLVALTGYGRPEDKRRCQEAGFSEHLTKPVEVKRVFASLDRVRAARAHGQRHGLS